jgi:hypothetical protein
VDADDLGAGGVRHVLRVDGTELAWVRADLDLTWPEGVSEWRIDPAALVLEVGGQRIAPIGRMTSEGFAPQAVRMSARKPSGDPKTLRWGFAFPVPAGTRGAATLHLGDVSAPLTLADGAADGLAAAVDVRVGAARRVPTVPSKVQAGSWSGTTTYSRPGGDFVEVELVLVPRSPNQEAGTTGFFWSTGWLGLAWEGGSVAPIGEDFGGKVSNPVSHNVTVGEEPRAPVKLWFPVPAGALPGAHLTFLGERVAELPLGR